MKNLNFELVKMKIDLLNLKNRVIATENQALRLRLKENARQRRENKKTAVTLAKGLQNSLFDNEKSRLG